MVSSLSNRIKLFRSGFSRPISILVLCLLLSSCSFTNKTGTAKNFNKKHYNKNFFSAKNKSLKDYSLNDEIDLNTMDLLESGILTSSIVQKAIPSKMHPIVPWSNKRETNPKIEEFEHEISSKHQQKTSPLKEEKSSKNPSRKNKKRALASLILGGVGLFFGYIGIPLAALILGKKVLKNSEKGSDDYRKGKIGRALGITGLIFRFIALCFLIMATFILVL